MSKLSRQELRTEFMSQLIAQKSGSVINCMLICDAIVLYVETGEIAALSPGDAALSPRRRDRQATQA